MYFKKQAQNTNLYKNLRSKLLIQRIKVIMLSNCSVVEKFISFLPTINMYTTEPHYLTLLLYIKDIQVVTNYNNQ